MSKSTERLRVAYGTQIQDLVQLSETGFESSLRWSITSAGTHYYSEADTRKQSERKGQKPYDFHIVILVATMRALANIEVKRKQSERKGQEPYDFHIVILVATM